MKWDIPPEVLVALIDLIGEVTAEVIRAQRDGDEPDLDSIKAAAVARLATRPDPADIEGPGDGR